MSDSTNTASVSLDDLTNVLENWRGDVQKKDIVSEDHACFGAFSKQVSNRCSHQRQDFHTFTVMVSGAVRVDVEFEDGPTRSRRRVLNGDDIVFSPANVARTVEINCAPSPTFSMIFPTAQLQAALEDVKRADIDPEKTLKGFAGTPSPRMRHLNRLITAEFMDPRPGDRAMTNALMDAFLIELGRTLIDSEATANVALLSDEERSRILELMESAIDGSLQLGDIADALGMEPYQLSRKFRASFGETARSHLMRLRLERARCLLQETDEPLAEVAVACGFSSQAHMTTCFGKQIGTTPARYRAERQTQPAS